MSRKISTGARFHLGESLTNDLIDYCAASHNAAAIEVIRDAVAEFINERLKNAETKKLFDRARRNRLEIRLHDNVTRLSSALKK